MAITGTFTADFSSFYDAVTKAEISLRAFEASSSKVETALSRMVDSFTGRKIISDAALAAEAVERIGGVSKLTEAELQKVGAIASEAANKLRAMGQDVPPGIQNIADAAKDADKAHRSLSESVKDVVLGFAALFTARAAFNFAKDVINDASALKDLSQQTHINVEEIQLLAGAISEFGVDADTLGKGLFTLSRKIAGGDESVARALHLMGLSLKDVEGLQGQELFLKMEHGLSTLQGSLRDTAASDLFGSKLGAAMAGASEGIDGALDSARRLNTVMSKESVDSLDAFGESIERANRSIHAMAANMIGPLAQGFNTIVDVANKGASKWAVTWAILQDALTPVGTGTEHLAALIDDLNKKTDTNTAATTAAAAAHNANAGAISAEAQAEKFMAALKADAAKELTDAQVKHLEQLRDIGALTAANAAAIGVNGEQFRKYVEAVNAASDALHEQFVAVGQLEDAYTKLHLNVIRGLEKMRVEGEKDMAALTKVVNDAVIAELNAQTQLNKAQGLDAAGAIEVQTTALGTYQKALEALHATKVEGISQSAQEQVLMDALSKSLYDDAIAQDHARDATAGHNTELAKLPSLANEAAGSLQGLVVSAEALRQAYAAAGFITHAGISGLGSPPIQARAGGGSVSAGSPYMVGERGPELFVPGSSGSILPNGGGMRVSITINGSVLGNKDEIATAVSEALAQRLRSQGRRFPVDA